VAKLADAWKYAKPAMKYANPDSARKFAQHMVPHVVRPAQIIWNKAIGAIFLLFAILFFSNAYKYFHTLQSDSPNPIGLGFSLFLGAIMGFFGITSFLKARRIERLLK
jgi:hypothetical protein